MSDTLGRRYGAGPRESAVRLAALVFVLAGCVGTWRLFQSRAIYWLACASFGNPAAVSVVERAARERVAALNHLPLEPPSWMYWSLQTRAMSFAGRRSGAAVLREARPVRSDGGSGWRCEWYVLDERLDPLGRITVETPIQPWWPPDDRDGDGSIEYIDHSQRRDASDPQLFSVVRLGREKNTLLAVIVEPVAAPTTAPALQYAIPFWTDSNADGRGELEFRAYRTVGPPGGTVELRLAWSGAGGMVVRQPSTTGFRVWLPSEGETVTFGPNERVDEVARRVIGDLP